LDLSRFLAYPVFSPRFLALSRFLAKYRCRLVPTVAAVMGLLGMVLGGLALGPLPSHRWPADRLKEAAGQNPGGSTTAADRFYKFYRQG
jgi:hypothetical protein